MKLVGNKATLKFKICKAVCIGLATRSGACDSLECITSHPLPYILTASELTNSSNLLPSERGT